jgi:hypothetical protein
MACVTAGAKPFGRVVGVELVAEFNAVARAKVDRMRPKLRCQDIELVTANVVEWAIPDGLTYVYLFNPFGRDILREVLANICRSARPAPAAAEADICASCLRRRHPGNRALRTHADDARPSSGHSPVSHRCPHSNGMTMPVAVLAADGEASACTRYRAIQHIPRSRLLGAVAGPASFRTRRLAEEASVFASFGLGIMPLPDNLTQV